LPIVLLRIRDAPRTKIHLSPIEILYRRPFLSNDLVTDPKTDSLLKYTMELQTFQQAIQKLGNKVLPASTKAEKFQIEPEEQMLIKSWKEGALADRLQPKGKGPYPVILAIPMAVTCRE
jgi:hypothetical protein